MARWWSRPDGRRTRALAAALGACAIAAPLVGARCSVELRTGVFADGERDGLGGSLIGSWGRVEIVGDSAGRTVETTWTFATDGDVVQQVVARNLNGSLIEGSTRRGRWRTEGGVVVVEFTTSAERRRYSWRIERTTGGERLLLDGDAYARVTG